MFSLSNLIVLFIIDSILINIGIYISFYIKFFGHIPEYNLHSYETLFFPLTISYLICIFLSGLYRLPKYLSYYKIIKKSIKASILASILSMTLAYLFRNHGTYTFPTTVFIISIFVNSIILTCIRIVIKMSEEKIELCNKIVAFFLNRILEAIIIFIVIYLAFCMRLLTFPMPEKNFSSFVYGSIIVWLAYTYFIYKFLLYKYDRNQSTFSVLYVMIKTSICVIFSSYTLFYIFRETIPEFPSSVLLISVVINYFCISILHILIHKNIISEIEVDLEAEEEFDEEEIAEEIQPEKDGFNNYFWSMFKPCKFYSNIEKYGNEFLGRTIILFICSWWMIAVYMCFMPDYVRNFFRRIPLGQDYYLNNFRVFILVIGTFYIAWILLNSIILKILRQQNISKYISGSLFIYGWNLILFLIVIIIGNYTSKYVMLTIAGIFSLWVFISKTKLIHKTFNIKNIPVIIMNVLSLFCIIIIYTIIIKLIY